LVLPPLLLPVACSSGAGTVPGGGRVVWGCIHPCWCCCCCLLCSQHMLYCRNALRVEKHSSALLGGRWKETVWRNSAR
jgi:hypothetical protein